VKEVRKKINLFILLLLMGVALEALNSSSLHAQVSYPVTISNIRFLGGGGRGPTSFPPDYVPVNYYRGYGIPGTSIELTATMNVGGSQVPMYGAVSFTVSYTDGTNSDTFTVVIPSGSATGTAAIPYDSLSGFNPAWLTSGSTVPWSYTVTAVSGDYASGVITSSASETIRWDRGDAPSTGTPAIVFQQVVTTTSSCSLYWTPLDTTAAGDQDFYEYLVYYRETGTSTYKLWNGATDAALRGLANNPFPAPVSDAVKRFDVNGWKYTTITNLKLFTGYDFYITAVDVFGNEITEANAAPPAGSRTFRTQPYSILVTISDGYPKEPTNPHSYTNFAGLPSTRPLFEINTKVQLNIISSGEEPEVVRVWYTDYSSEPTNMVDTVLNKANTAAFGSPCRLLSVEATNPAPNTWIAYIPTKTTPPILFTGNTIRFVVETVRRGSSAFADMDMSDLDPNDDEWTYTIVAPPKLTPHPTRVLNNVITSKKSESVAYPSYYLSEDAYVSITVYDIKGRLIVSLIDKAFRRGGQNIKEEGWNGSNKSSNKVGVGLYYMQIYAKNTKGKVILNSFEKVIVAK